MRNLQPIIHQGQLAAVVVAGLAVIEDTLTDTARRHVQAMCLYALEISDRERPGPYNDAAADAYARTAVTRNPARTQVSHRACLSGDIAEEQRGEHLR